MLIQPHLHLLQGENITLRKASIAITRHRGRFDSRLNQKYLWLLRRRVGPLQLFEIALFVRLEARKFVHFRWHPARVADESHAQRSKVCGELLARWEAVIRCFEFVAKVPLASLPLFQTYSMSYFSMFLFLSQFKLLLLNMILISFERSFCFIHKQ